MGEKKYFTIDDNLCIANKDSKWGVLNSNLETIVPFEYEDIAGTYINDKNKTYYMAEKNYSCGLLDINNGEYIEKFKFSPKDTDEDKYNYYSKISLIGEKDGKFGITDAYGNFVIPPVYDKIESWGFDGMPDFSLNGKFQDIDIENRFLIYKDGKIGVSDNKSVLREPIFDSIDADTCSNKLLDWENTDEEELNQIFMRSIKEGYTDYNRSYPYFKAVVDGKYGYIDINGNTIFDFKYADANNPDYRKLTVAKTFDETVEFINLITKKVIFSVPQKNITGYSITHNHICILTYDDNLYRIIDENGNVFASFKNSKSLNGRKLSYLNNSFLVECKKSFKSCKLSLFNMSGKKIKLDNNYSWIQSVSGTSNIVLQKSDNSGNTEYYDIINNKGEYLFS